MVGLEAFQAAFEPPQEVIAAAVGNLGGKKHFLAPRRHHLADPCLALAVPVGVGRVEISDAKVESAVEGFERLLFLRVHQKPAAAAEGQDRDAGPGAAENAVRQRAGRTLRHASQERNSCAAGRKPLQKLSARKIFVHDGPPSHVVRRMQSPL